MRKTKTECNKTKKLLYENKTSLAVREVFIYGVQS